MYYVSLLLLRVMDGVVCNGSNQCDLSGLAGAGYDPVSKVNVSYHFGQVSNMGFVLPLSNGTLTSSTGKSLTLGGRREKTLWFWCVS